MDVETLCLSNTVWNVSEGQGLIGFELFVVLRFWLQVLLLSNVIIKKFFSFCLYVNHLHPCVVCKNPLPTRKRETKSSHCIVLGGNKIIITLGLKLRSGLEIFKF